MTGSTWNQQQLPLLLNHLTLWTRNSHKLQLTALVSEGIFQDVQLELQVHFQKWTQFPTLSEIIRGRRKCSCDKNVGSKVNLHSPSSINDDSSFNNNYNYQKTSSSGKKRAIGAKFNVSFVQAVTRRSRLNGVPNFAGSADFKPASLDLQKNKHNEPVTHFLFIKSSRNLVESSRICPKTAILSNQKRMALRRALLQTRFASNNKFTSIKVWFRCWSVHRRTEIWNCSNAFPTSLKTCKQINNLSSYHVFLP